jgi:hypothetical protein
MNRKKIHIDEFFRRGLSAYGEKAPINAWEGVEQQLNSPMGRRKYYYFRLIAAAAALIITFGAGYFFARYNIRQPEGVLVSQTRDQNMTGDSRAPQNNVEQEAGPGITVVAERPLPNPALHASGGSQNLQTTAASLTGEQQITSPPGQPGISNMEPGSLAGETKQPDQNLVAEDIPMKKPAGREADISPAESLNPRSSDAGLLALGHHRQDANKENHWMVGGQVSPVYSYRSLEPSGVESRSGMDRSGYDSLETGHVSLAGGVSLSYATGSRWIFKTGIYYSEIGQHNAGSLIYKSGGDHFYLYMVNSSIGEIDAKEFDIPSEISVIADDKDLLNGASVTDAELVQLSGYLEMPVTVGYNLLARKLGILVAGGISPGILVKNNAYIEYNDSRYNIGKTDAYRSMIYNALVSMGMRYTLTKRISLNFEPTIKYALLPVNRNAPMDYHPYSLSFFTGASYSF